jgi:hypothetical protein
VVDLEEDLAVGVAVETVEAAVIVAVAGVAVVDAADAEAVAARRRRSGSR